MLVVVILMFLCRYDDILTVINSIFSLYKSTFDVITKN